MIFHQVNLEGNTYHWQHLLEVSSFDEIRKIFYFVVNVFFGDEEECILLLFWWTWGYSKHAS